MHCGIICGRITPARGNLEHRPLSGAVCRVAIVRDPVTLAAEDPQEYEERTVMILEPSKK